jgi:hypothetical protein
VRRAGARLRREADARRAPSGSSLQLAIEVAESARDLDRDAFARGGVDQRTQRADDVGMHADACRPELDHAFGRPAEEQILHSRVSTGRHLESLAPGSPSLQARSGP